MKLLAGDSASFNRGIDPSFAAEESVVCRYRNLVQLDARPENDRRLKEYLLQCSIREGARIVTLMTYKDVVIHLLDETSGMATGTLKSIDGCLTTAFCRMREEKRIVFESGGNTGSAFTRYGLKAGMETFFFCPLANIDLLDSRLFQNREAHLIGVANRRQVKELAGLFARTATIRHVPEKTWRNAAAMFRGFFILESLLGGGRYDWLTQTVSAGFGPIGIYTVLEPFATEPGMMPKFLGIQQEANCPMYRAWKPDVAVRLNKAPTHEDKLLTKVMYDETPQTYRTFDELRHLLLQTQGDLLTVNAEEFSFFLSPTKEYGDILELLQARNIAISLRSGVIFEKTGMIGLAGTLKAIDSGMIKGGSRVLCCLTSGVSQADGKAEPEVVLRADTDVLAYARSVAGGK